MSEPIPEAIPTSADPRSRRPVKKLRGANTASASQANEIENLFYDPQRPVNIPQLSSESKAPLSAPPEIVANVQGSSAGAGSGEFHVYKASRRREYERLRAMDEEAKKEDDDEKWSKELTEKKTKDEERTRKNRERRNKRKGKKGKDETDYSTGDTKNGTVGHNLVKSQANAPIKKSLQIPRRDEETDEGSEAPVASEAVAETGITIHDDD